MRLLLLDILRRLLGLRNVALINTRPYSAMLKKKLKEPPSDWSRRYADAFGATPIGTATSSSMSRLYPLWGSVTKEVPPQLGKIYYYKLSPICGPGEYRPTREETK